MNISKLKLTHEPWAAKFPWSLGTSRHAVIYDKDFWLDIYQAAHAIRGIDPYPLSCVRYLMRVPDYDCVRSKRKNASYIRLAPNAGWNFYLSCSPSHNWYYFHLSEYPNYGHNTRLTQQEDDNDPYNPFFAFVYDGTILLITAAKLEYLTADHLNKEQFLTRFNHIKDYTRINFPYRVIEYK